MNAVSCFLDVSNIPDISCENEPLDVQTFVKKHMEKWYFECLIYVNISNFGPS